MARPKDTTPTAVKLDDIDTSLMKLPIVDLTASSDPMLNSLNKLCRCIIAAGILTNFPNPSDSGLRERVNHYINVLST